MGQKLRLMPSLFFETSSVETSAVNAAAIDAPKLDLALVLEWRPVKHLVLGAHLGATAFILGDVASRYHPRDTVACVDANFDLATRFENRPACQDVINGNGLPSASGQYTLFTLHLGAALGLDY